MIVLKLIIIHIIMLIELIMHNVHIIMQKILMHIIMLISFKMLNLHSIIHILNIMHIIMH